MLKLNNIYLLLIEVFVFLVVLMIGLSMIGCIVGNRVGDDTRRYNHSNRLHGAEYGGSFCTICRQRECRESSAETQGENRTQVGCLPLFIIPVKNWWVM